MVRFSIVTDMCIGVAVILGLAHCGQPARNAKPIANAPVLEAIPTPAPLSCQATPSATVLNAFADAAGNLLANMPAPTVQVAVSAARGGVPSAFSIVRVSTSSADFKVETDPATSGANLNQIIFRPYKKGVHTGTISLSSSDNIAEVVTCSFQVELKTSNPPDLRVMIAANGAGPALTLSEGQGAVINWAAVNATACQLLKDGIPLPVQPPAGVLSGEFAVGPFPNPTNAPLSTIYGIECQGAAGAAMVQRAAVGLTINPIPRADLQIVGAGAAKTIHTGEYVDVAWTSTYAVGGCLLTNGIIGDIVPPSGQVRVENITANMRFTLACRDNYRGAVTVVANVTALNPRVTITANGNRFNFVQGIRESFSIAWTAADVTGCSVLPFGDTRIVGSTVVPAAAFNRNTAYQVTCQSYFGTVTDTVNVSYLGDWFQTVKADFGGQKDCNSFCSSLGRLNINSPDGSRCASGELIPPSALGKIAFTKGCGGYSCSVPHGAPNGQSDGGPANAFCWGTGQKTNKNASDEVMGCFCR